MKLTTLDVDVNDIPEVIEILGQNFHPRLEPTHQLQELLSNLLFKWML